HATFSFLPFRARRPACVSRTFFPRRRGSLWASQKRLNSLPSKLTFHPGPLHPMARTMRWLQTEYILKGVYLGFLVFVALQEPDWRRIGLVALCTFGGLFLCLAVAGYRKWREGYRPRGRWPAFLLFLLLESPDLVYAGILLGLATGAFAVRK